MARREAAAAAKIFPAHRAPVQPAATHGIFQTENGPQALANGGQYENNSITIDGISTTSAVWGGTTIITPSEDSVESVKVVSNSYDAESGRFSGAQIQVTSKSGSNKFHGSLFFTAHRPGLNAYQRFNGAGNSVLRDDNFFNQFGGSVGGPIWKNKIFAFFNYETVRSPNSRPTSPTDGTKLRLSPPPHLPEASPRRISVFPVLVSSARASILPPAPMPA